MTPDQFDIVIVGAGPAGMAAACTASERGGGVAVIDDSPGAGGQIWRGGDHQWLRAFRRAKVSFLPGTRVVDWREPRVLLAEDEDGARELSCDKLILATGARERFLPFPGWTVPNVLGAGGLQALVKSGLPVDGKRVVVAGTGPLLLAVAAYLKQQGGIVSLIAEQTSDTALLRFGVQLLRTPGKLWQAAGLRAALAGVPYRTNCWITAAEGDEHVTRVRLNNGETIACDYVACGFGLVPSTELAQLLSCTVQRGFVVVNEMQETSVPGVYCAGEPTGIGGVDLAVIEGRIAGYAASGQTEKAATLTGRSKRLRKFANALEETFSLREEIRTLAQADTIVCRCEDVTYGALADHDNWRAAKLHTRCGMGPCQGRVCGPAVEYLFGWKPDSVRPPILPARVGSLAGLRRP